MEIVIGVIVLLVLAGIAAFALRKKPALPPSEPAAEPRLVDAQSTQPSDVGQERETSPVDIEIEDEDRKTPIVSDPALLDTHEEAQTPPVPEQPEAASVLDSVRQAPEPPSKQISTIDARPSDIEALKVGLATTRGGFIRKLKSLFEKPSIDASVLEGMEDVLLTSDIGVQTSEKILNALKDKVAAGELTTSDQMWSALRAQTLAILKDPSPAQASPVAAPRVFLFVGVNGVGKTTTIGKLASKFQADGKKVLLAAGDTYRAAAALQLEAWGERIGIPTVTGPDNADPASVAFDAATRRVAEGRDLLFVDTAGRLHTKHNLMEELKKVGRAAEKALGRPVDEIYLVLDATNGQNAIQQVELFGDALDLTGIVLTKLDGTAKGGVILGIRQRRPIPVRYIGVGEKVDDLREFNAESFVEALFSEA